MKAVRRSRTSLFNDVLRIFLLKKFSRVVVYCSVIKVPVVLSQATALIFYQIRFALSRTFLFFFFLSLPLTSQLNHSTTCIAICQPFFTSFFNFSRSPLAGTICGVFTWYYPTISPYFTVQISQSLSAHIWGLKNYRKDPVVFMDNIERRRRDLNPRAATNDLLPFQGSPFGQLGYFSKTERVGFEPTRPFGQTVFKTASLWPLRYLSIHIANIVTALCDVDYSITHIKSVSRLSF